MYTGLAGYDHRSALFAFKTNLFIEKYMQYISAWCIVFISNLCMPRRKSWFLRNLKFLCCCFIITHANYQLTNEIPSFVIYYSNKALSNQRPFHKSVENPLDHNKDFSFNLQTFSRALRREQRLFTSYYRSVKIASRCRIASTVFGPLFSSLYS